MKNFFNISSFFVNRKKWLKWSFLAFGISALLIPSGKKKSRKASCRKELSERFGSVDKYIGNKNLKAKDFCTIYPTNVYDIQKLLEIANHYKIPIMHDINYKKNTIFKSHIRIDFSKYNKIGELDEELEQITVDPGVKLFTLLDYLNKLNLTIPTLENFKYANLTIGDVVFNNLYSFNQEKHVDYYIKELTVVTPRKESIITYKQFDDINKSPINLKNLFLRSNSTLGLITEIKLKIKKLKNYKFLAVRNISNNIQEVVDLASLIKQNKYEFGLEDVNLIQKGKIIDLFIKIKENNLTNLIDVLHSGNVIYEQIDDASYYKSICLTNPDNPAALRTTKICLNRKFFPRLINKIDKMSKEYDVKFQLKCSNMKNEIELILKNENDVKNLENSYRFLNRLQDQINKMSGILFSNIMNN